MADKVQIFQQSDAFKPFADEARKAVQDLKIDVNQSFYDSSKLIRAQMESKFPDKNWSVHVHPRAQNSWSYT